MSVDDVRRFAILIESSDVKGHRDLNGARKDIHNWMSFLKSDLGGCWGDNEIEVLRKPSSADVKKLLADHAGGYVFLAFSGHGKGFDLNGHKYTFACLNENEELVNVDDISPKGFGSAIFDNCRWHDSNAVHSILNKLSSSRTIVMDSFSAANEGLNAVRLACLSFKRKKAYLNALTMADKKAVQIFSCSDEEDADEDSSNIATAGGLFTTMLINGAKDWAKARNSSSLNDIRTFSLPEAFSYAYKEVQSKIRQQHPEYKGHNNPPYPFAVN